jgi:hypothetical protein
MDKEADRVVRCWPQMPIAPSIECVTFVKLCRARAWTPIATQVTVGSTKHRTATRVDVVCRDKRNRMVLLELKCGYPNWYHACALLEPEYPTRNDCPANQAQVQLALTRWMFICTYPVFLQHPMQLQAFVVKLNRHEADVFPLEPWAMQGTDRLIPRLLHR